MCQRTARKTISEIRKTMSYVEKTSSDIGKIISDIIFMPHNILKNKSLHHALSLWHCSEIQSIMQYANLCSFVKASAMA